MIANETTLHYSILAMSSMLICRPGHIGHILKTRYLKVVLAVSAGIFLQKITKINKKLLKIDY